VSASADGIALRDATPEDAEFLARLYGDTRRHEVAAWGWPQAQQDAFLRMQFEAQRRSYHATFADAADHIVCLDGTPIGRMLVGQEPAGVRLIDIALFEENRNHGVGTSLLRQLLRECEAKGTALHLQVFQGNPAIHLYQRLGFVQCGADPMYAQMVWNPPSPSERS
jgi:GNAT superfamily N-acetyltransferase